jgi:hypothetical protein
VKFHIYFECCDTITEADVTADSKEDAVRIWENQEVSDDIKTNFGLFFLQPTYAEMCAAAHAKDCELVVTQPEPTQMYADEDMFPPGA